MVMPNPTPPTDELQALRAELAERTEIIAQLFDNLEEQIAEVHKHSKLVNARVDNLHQILSILMTQIAPGLTTNKETTP